METLITDRTSAAAEFSLTILLFLKAKTPAERVRAEMCFSPTMADVFAKKKAALRVWGQPRRCIACFVRSLGGRLLKGTVNIFKQRRYLLCIRDEEPPTYVIIRRALIREKCLCAACFRGGIMEAAQITSSAQLVPGMLVNRAFTGVSGSIEE
jgi:hypothetical protein